MSDWVEECARYICEHDVSEMFARWTAIATVGAALERKVWARTKRGAVYPNLYVMLIADPGIGKSLPISIAESMLRAIRNDDGDPTHYVTATSVTAASLIDDLFDAERTVGKMTFHAMAAFSDELSVMMKQYDPEFAARLIKFWDNAPFNERRRSRDTQISMEKTCLTLLAGTQPAFIGQNFPDAAWDQGFMARVIPAFTTQRIESDLFGDAPNLKGLEKQLRADINVIGRRTGELVFTKGVQERFKTWIANGREPKPEHPRLTHYNLRRQHQLCKLCIISAASTQSEEIEPEHFDQALDWLQELEQFLPDLFRHMGGSGDARILQDGFHFLLRQFVSTDKTPVPQTAMHLFFQDRVPAWQVSQMLDAFVNGGYATVKQVNKIGPCYLPHPERIKEMKRDRGVK